MKNYCLIIINCSFAELKKTTKTQLFKMKFFIDTANLDQIKEAQDLGILDGVTTNPSLMAKGGYYWS